MIDDTIAAIATAPGECGISIIRISGPKSLDIIEGIFVSKKGLNLKGFPSRRLIYGHILDKEKDRIVDEVLVVYMPGPYTYTKEDVVEVNCHGGIIPVRNVLELILRNGARMAEPGEFTKRAFLNGRIDLAQAEAVMDIISAKTDKGFDVAFKQLEGTLSKRVSKIRSKLVEIIAHVQVSIDYTEEDIQEITYEELYEETKEIKGLINKLLETADTGKILREGLSTAIIGKPNVGKSSLLNSLLKESRAIVTDIPGTTRDIIEEYISIKGIPLKIVDTAGIRDTEDIVEKIGVERSKEIFNRADLVILVLDSSQKLTKEDYEIMEYVKERQSIVLINKTDLPQRIDEDEVNKILSDKKIIKVSLIEEKGLDELENEIVNMVYDGRVIQKNSSYVTNIRHKNALERALRSINEAIMAVEQEFTLDLIEVDLEDTYMFLGEITGETVAEDIIDTIFSNFCLGK